jgi:hypothetical protein
MVSLYYNREGNKHSILTAELLYFLNIAVDIIALFLHSLEFICLISFSNLIARAMFPLIFNLPDMKAIVGFSFPKMRK